MKIEIFKNINDLESVKADWIELLQKSQDPRMFNGYEWFKLSLEIFHHGDSVHVVGVRSGDNELVCLAPLVIIKERYRNFTVSKISFVANNQNPSNDFIYLEQCKKECLDVVFGYLEKNLDWDLVGLSMINANGCTGFYIQDRYGTSGHKFGIKKNRVSPYINLTQDWDEYWSSRSVKFKKSMRNKVNKINKVTFSVEKIKLTGVDQDALDAMLKISSNSWKSSIGTDLLTRVDNWSFYKKASSVYGNSGNISLYFLIIDGSRAAFEFHFEDGRVAYPVRADYDQNFEKFSPGSILEYEIIKRLFSEKYFDEYNSCGHTYQYLLNWTESTREFVNFEIFGKALKSYVIYVVEYVVLPVLRESKIFMYIKDKIIRQ